MDDDTDLGSMIISICGDPGSGKSTIRKLLAKRLGYKQYSMGDLRGKMALERGLTIDQLNKVGEKEAWTDNDVDDYQKKLGETEDNFVIEGRTSYHFIPRSFKIKLEVSLEEGARRIMSGEDRPDEPKAASIQEKARQLEERIASDTLRYKKYYNLDVADRKNYDLIVDTTDITPKQVVDAIVAEMKKRHPALK